MPSLVRGLGPDKSIVAPSLRTAVRGQLRLGLSSEHSLTPFLLVPLLGVRGTGLTAGILNLGLAITAFALSRKHYTRAAHHETRKPLRGEAQMAVTLYALAGGIALGYEVVWTQAIVQFLSTRTYAFALVVATYLAGLVLGSFLHARLADQVNRPWTVFGLLVGGAGASALILVCWGRSLDSETPIGIRLDGLGSYGKPIRHGVQPLCCGIGGSHSVSNNPSGGSVSCRCSACRSGPAMWEVTWVLLQPSTRRVAS